MKDDGEVIRKVNKKDIDNMLQDIYDKHHGDDMHMEDY